MLYLKRGGFNVLILCCFRFYHTAMNSTKCSRPLTAGPAVAGRGEECICMTCLSLSLLRDSLHINCSSLNVCGHTYTVLQRVPDISNYMHTKSRLCIVFISPLQAHPLPHHQSPALSPTFCQAGRPVVN